jgi:hypothetical protein
MEWLVAIAVVLFVLRWLRKNEFVRKATRALRKSVVAFVLLAACLYLVSLFANASDSVEELISRNTDAVLIVAAIAIVVGAFKFYEGRPSTKITSKTVRPRTDSSAGSQRGGRCASCRGSGQVDDNCGSCSGMGEIRCNYVKKGKHWYGDEYTDGTCQGGKLRKWEAGYGDYDDGVCPNCNGRGFERCYGCRGRGIVRTTCAECQGSGDA